MSKKEKDLELDSMRHSAAHVLASAVLELFPDTKLGIGPTIEDGFYYDFDFKSPLSPSDLKKIEKKMREIIKKNLPFKKEELSVKDGIKLFKDLKQPYKVELIKDLEKEGEKKVSIYRTGDFADLCKGPHVKSTKEVKAFRLDKVAGAYWKGDEKNKMLQRIYGIAFNTKEELQKYLKMMEEAKKRDHRKIGKELELFFFHSAAPGDPFWQPKGLILIKELFKYWREIHEREGYVEVRTPEILTRKVWDQSGHTDFFIEKIYKVTTPDSKEWNMAIKPMNCDGGIIIYKTRPRSYKEFPLRMGELGVVHRYESSGEIHGILRLREFIQDDAHIFCTSEQIKDELKGVMDLCFEVYKTFGLELDRLELSTRPEKSIGSDEIWERAENIMRQVLKEKDVPYQINEGDGAFYGPKFDFHLKDSIGRTWQCSTIQLDFAQPENFDLEYITKKGTRKRPVMIHRVLYGSIERFLGILIEDCAGAFPLWLSPIQARIIPISPEKHGDYAKELEEKLRQNFRVDLDIEEDTIGKRIRNAEKQKIPYMIIVGDKEVKGKKVAIRKRGRKDLGQMDLKKLVEMLEKEIKEKK